MLEDISQVLICNKLFEKNNDPWQDIFQLKRILAQYGYIYIHLPFFTGLKISFSILLCKLKSTLLHI